MSRTLIVIPARFASTRLPGKPLLAETGKPLIQHTFEAASRVPGAEVIVATDDPRIADAVAAFGGVAVMTDPDHQSGTDRVAEAARDRGAEVIVNLQGDEPEIDPDSIATLVETHRRTQSGSRPAFVSTLACPFPEDSDPSSPDAVKAVLGVEEPDGARSALYFSRAPIPFPRSQEAAPLLHIGLYAYSAESLQRYPRLPRTPLEKTESLEQLRVLEHGLRIAAAIVPAAAPGIDTPSDYAAFVRRQEAQGQSTGRSGS
jgi:3-deoxy-manno-octulosonate cytidylyltransferase (CMP-KDO synthetase)